MAETGDTLLLVIDDESSVCRALRRLMRGRVDEIVTAETPADAEAILDTRAVTHVICDHLLGPGQPRGIDLARRWRERYPAIAGLVVLTGTNVANLEAPPEVDHVLPKTTDPTELARRLGLAGAGGG